MIYKNTARHTVLFLCIIFLSSHTVFASWLMPSEAEISDFLSKTETSARALGKDFNAEAKITGVMIGDEIGKSIAKHAEPKLTNFSNSTLVGINKELSRIPGLIEEGTYRSVHKVAPFIVPVLACGLGACMGMALMYQSLNEIIKLKTVDQGLPDELQHNNDPQQTEREEIKRKARWFNAIIRGASGFVIVVACVTTNSFVQPTEETPKTVTLFPDWS